MKIYKLTVLRTNHLEMLRLQRDEGLRLYQQERENHRVNRHELRDKVLEVRKTLASLRTQEEARQSVLEDRRALQQDYNNLYDNVQRFLSGKQYALRDLEIAMKGIRHPR